MRRVLDIKLEGDAERVRRSIVEAIEEIQRLKAVPTDVIPNQVLPDNQVVLVPHKLGRAPVITLISPPRGATLAGIIVEIFDVAAGNPDRSKYVALKAGGMGADVTVDVEVK